MSSFQDKVNFLWSVPDLIRDHFKRGKYQDVILPLTVLRRISYAVTPVLGAVRVVSAGREGQHVEYRK